MAQNQIRRLPVVENGELVGIVAIGDLAVRGNFEDEAGEALSQISQESTLVGSHQVSIINNIAAFPNSDGEAAFFR